ncbi:SDR family NAD(P)-dependent oxidoreductase [Cupriavidus basilensis]
MKLDYQTRQKATGISGKTAVIIGGTSGIGRAVANRFIAAGGAVILGGRSQETLDAELARIAAAGGTRLRPCGRHGRAGNR